MNALPILALLLLAGPPRPEMLEAPSMGVWRNARIETRAGTGSLADSIRSAATGREPAWGAYGVPGTGRRMIGCWQSGGHWKSAPCRSGCSLERHKDDGSFSISDDEEDCRGSNDLRILYRVAEGRIGKIRALSDLGPVDAGNLRVVWLEGVDPAASVAFLESLLSSDLDGSSRDDDDKPALTALAMHGDPSADARSGATAPRSGNDSGRPAHAKASAPSVPATAASQL